MAKSFLNMAGYPLGLRNNNPGNIRPFDQWQGMIGENQGFAVFKDISWGLRAMAKAIIHEFNVGNNNLVKLINEWAPPSENNTEAYIAAMVNYTGFSRNQTLSATGDTLKRVMRGIMKMELGASYAALITDTDIQEGIDLIGEIDTTTAATGFGLSVLIFSYAVYLLVTSPKVKQYA